MIDRMNPATRTSEESIIYSLQSSFLLHHLGLRLFFSGGVCEVEKSWQPPVARWKPFYGGRSRGPEFPWPYPSRLGKEICESFVMELVEIGFKWEGMLEHCERGSCKSCLRLIWLWLCSFECWRPSKVAYISHQSMQLVSLVNPNPKPNTVYMFGYL